VEGVEADLLPAAAPGRCSRVVYSHESHTSPLSPSRPSLTSHGTMRSAATGSAHHQPAAALATRPSRSVKDRYEHASVSLASARSAALPSSFAALSLAQDTRGMMTSDAAASAMPTTLSLGASWDQRVHVACPVT